MRTPSDNELVYITDDPDRFSRHDVVVTDDFRTYRVKSVRMTTRQWWAFWVRHEPPRYTVRCELINEYHYL